MPDHFECQGTELYELGRDLLDAGVSLHIEVRGWSMHPIIKDGDKIQVSPVTIDEVNVGDIVLFRSGDRLLAHRIISYSKEEGFISLWARGDRFRQPDPPFGEAELVGRVVMVFRSRRGSQRVIRLDRGPSRWFGSFVAHSRVAHHCYRWGAHGLHRFENLKAKVRSLSDN